MDVDVDQGPAEDQNTGNEIQIESETDSTNGLEGTGIGLTLCASINLLKELSAASEIEMQNLKKELLTESEKLSQQHNPGIILLNTITYESAKQFRDQGKKLPKSWGHLSSFQVPDLKLGFTRIDSRVSFQKLTLKI